MALVKSQLRKILIKNKLRKAFQVQPMIELEVSYLILQMISSS